MVMPKGLKAYWAKKRRGKSSRRKSRGGVRSMSRKKNKFTVPLAVVAGMIPLAHWGITDYKAEGFRGLLKTAETIIPWNFSRTNRNPDGSEAGFYTYKLRYGLYPILAGFAVHKIASAIGVNRMLQRAGIPFIRI